MFIDFPFNKFVDTMLFSLETGFSADSDRLHSAMQLALLLWHLVRQRLPRLSPNAGRRDDVSVPLPLFLIICPGWPRFHGGAAVRWPQGGGLKQSWISHDCTSTHGGIREYLSFWGKIEGSPSHRKFKSCFASCCNKREVSPLYFS